MSNKDINSINFSNNIKNIIKNEFPKVKRIKEETKTAISMCILEFSKILAAAIATECDKHGKLVVQKDVVDACKTLGFPEYATKAEAVQMPKKQEKPKPKETGLTQQQMIELQKELYRQARDEIKHRESFDF
ncbi:hypothetical protein TVAG_306300 [Trichomonas vaginalis G3]|uniref:Transcription factor CBF/NF-Y/archaeal histone domain-containing protein n=1 Tax=Trichomonas vaginalis (strain ATCC PRA-98 / G3) TaxID=412133 RepID=A2DNC0_TRIV3|nr:histone, subunit A domain-containing protein [Trichomonas vaginalis G3]EAY18108.1 hypothetical protein TVAG_306300 [Trichomonas vaginalis G3]KAI5492385.1 histone, subunit A domain-containing protein [Trichomonas vaginalis G3]|eukprot:XP_001579094.1 hypothetical protein [Trichomonas vaginalis G3]